MQGMHLTADLHACATAGGLMTDARALRGLCLREVDAAGLTPVGELFHAFAAHGGLTGVVLLAESHLAIHTWPELGAVTLDVYVCNVGADNTARAEQLMAALVEAFAPGRIERHGLQRGRLAA